MFVLYVVITVVFVFVCFSVGLWFSYDCCLMFCVCCAFGYVIFCCFVFGVLFVSCCLSGVVMFAGLMCLGTDCCLGVVELFCVCLVNFAL